MSDEEIPLDMAPAVIVAEAYGLHFTSERFEVWTRMLSDLDPETTRQAALAWISTEPKPPSIADIRNIAAGGWGSPAAADAWGEVTSKIRSVGAWGTPTFSSEIVTAAVASMGGWQTLCASETQMADRAHFLRVFDQLAARAKRDASIHPEVRGVLSDIGERCSIGAGLEGRGMQAAHELMASMDPEPRRTTMPEFQRQWKKLQAGIQTVGNEPKAERIAEAAKVKPGPLSPEEQAEVERVRAWAQSEEGT